MLSRCSLIYSSCQAYISQKRSWLRLNARYILYGGLGLLIASLVVLALLNTIFPLHTEIEHSQVILDQDSTVLHIYLTPDEKWRLKTELSEIMPELRQAIIHKEDKYFYYHFGVNPFAVVRAFWNNMIQLKTTSGASTITMQVARLLVPKSRSFTNKLVETFRALQLEWYLSKEEILQLYLNLVPYGGNIEGVKSASLLYFNRMPDQLSLAQITTLAVIPNRPTSLVIGKNNAEIKSVRDRWLRKFSQAHLFTKKNIQSALSEPLEATRLSPPRAIPHLARRLRALYPQQNSLYTSIHADTQKKVEQLTANYVRRLSYLGIHHAAVLVVDNRDRTVRAYIGSPDFGDKLHAGEVDGITATRSPGSTLKPLAYATAIDQGHITPKYVLADVPSDFRGFAPENFYQQYNGKVTVEEALIRSLNTTAVKVLEQIGLTTFIQKLKQADFRSIARKESQLGLSLILGGCGASLEELVGLYACFAKQGVYQPLRLLATDSVRYQRRLVSREASYQITEILAKATRPDLPSGFENTFRIPKIAWKTGTSFGRRDAWSLGYNANYTVGVWVGNFSGKGANELVGASVATPLLFEVFNTINYNPEKDWFAAPPNLGVRWVCSETGKIPNDFCQNQVIDTYIPLISPTETCDHMKEVLVSTDEQVSYCMTCLPQEGYQKKHYLNLSPELTALYRGQGIKYRSLPPHNPACTRWEDDQQDAPRIVSPSADKMYLIDQTAPPQLELSCEVAPEVKTVYWYLNDVFFQASPAGKSIFFEPEIGMMKISCSDDKGRNHHIQIRVLAQ